jgi:peptidoglycan/xylan/chitin deacetylase (PgdA/CDA1 family)
VPDVLSRFAGGRLVIFGYHRIRADERQTTPFADELYGPTIAEFERQMRWLLRHADILSEDALLRRLNGVGRSRRLAAMVTFDDGYRDNYTLAFPVLQRLRIPATLFVPALNIEERRLGWWDLIAWLVKRTTRKEIELDGVWYDLTNGRGRAISLLQRRMQFERQERTRGLVERLAEACRQVLPNPREQSAEIMSWEELREVSDGVVAVGSHTHTHRVLATLDPDAQREELEESRKLLELRLSRPVRSIAYPVGGYRHFTADSMALAEQCGYLLGYSFWTGFNRWKSIERFDVKRIGAPSPPALFAATAALPEIFSWH